MIRLSNKQLAFLDAIEKHVRRHNYSPSVRELALAVGLKSPSTAHGYLNRLKERGLINWQAERQRTLKIVNAGEGDSHA